MVDQKTISDCLAGKKRAQRALFAAYAQKMFVHCYRYLKSKEDAEEIVSEGFSKAFQNLDRFVYKDNRGLEAWIKRIMINECLMFLRKKKIEFLNESSGLSVASQIKSDDQLEAEEIYNLVLALPDGYRTVFNLYAIEGYSHKEIAKMLNISQGTSRSQLTKARIALKEMVRKANA